jgi:hypothetical protein
MKDGIFSTRVEKKFTKFDNNFLTKFVGLFPFLYKQGPNNHMPTFNTAVNTTFRGVQDGNAQDRLW